jgi:hypothetical protein
MKICKKSQCNRATDTTFSNIDGRCSRDEFGCKQDCYFSRIQPDLTMVSPSLEGQLVKRLSAGVCFAQRMFLSSWLQSHEHGNSDH